MIRRLLFVLLWVGLFSCSSDDETLPDDTPLEEVSLLDLSYGNHPEQRYDLYLPEGRTAETTKVLVLVHGGGWTGGDKADMGLYVELVQQRQKDYAIVNVNYVLANETTPAYPNQINDIMAVIEDVKSKASEHQIRPKFGFIGVSAGAHLSLLYSYAFDTDNDVEMVCSVIGPADFTDPAYLADSSIYQEEYSILIGGDFSSASLDLLEEVSPVHQVDGSAPPTIMFYGNTDPLIPNSQHQNLKAVLDENGILNSLTVYDGGHGDWDLFSYLDLNAQLSAFMDSNL